MSAADYRLVSYATRQDTATRAGILFRDSVTDARTVLGPEARDRKSTRLNSSHPLKSRMPSSA